MAHVINLAAHNGLKVFGGSIEEPLVEEEITLQKMDINLIVDRPDGAELNLQTVISRIHGLATYTRGLPQRREGFQAMIDFVNTQSKSEKPIKNIMLMLDVRTRWNSTYLMLKRALRLRLVCT
jgi:hypothetical protein